MECVCGRGGGTWLHSLETRLRCQVNYAILSKKTSRRGPGKYRICLKISQGHHFSNTCKSGFTVIIIILPRMVCTSIHVHSTWESGNSA